MSSFILSTETIKDILAKILNNKPKNRVVYGAPGTGKSNKLDEEVQLYFPKKNRLRVTFHPNYSYSQFVGSYKPIVIYKEGEGRYFKSDAKTVVDDSKQPVITYEFVPGPFIQLLVKALKSKEDGTNEPYVLIIEELNRAKTAATFGDIFQLLDRNSEGDSQYSITFGEEVKDYLSKSGVAPQYVEETIIPSNLFLWSTMNSSDQGIVPLDAAFKRRWSFEYVKLNEYSHVVKDWNINLSFTNHPVEWNVFRAKVNQVLKDNNVVEDKLLGPFFLKKEELEDEYIIKNKLLLYLREDALKMNPLKLFKYRNFSDLVDEYDAKKNIFTIDF